MAIARLPSIGVANLAMIEAGASVSSSYLSAARAITPSIPMPSPTGVVEISVTFVSLPSTPAVRNSCVTHSGVSCSGWVGYERSDIGAPLQPEAEDRQARFWQA